MKTVWIVDEGTPGHLSQSLGLVEAMKARIALNSVQVFGRLTARGWQRPLIRSIMGRNGRPLPAWLLRSISRIEIPENAPPPDLIVSSGGKSVIPARTWSHRFRVPYAFVGRRGAWPANWFHTVVTHVPEEAKETNAIAVDLIPSPITPTRIAAYGSIERNTWCMAIGGASPSYNFCDEDWRAVAEGMNVLAEQDGIRWLITTSRRTGARVERILKQYLRSEILQDAIWWSEHPRREFYRFISRSEVVFVTQDSVTMVTEAVSSGRPVVALYPNGKNVNTTDFKAAYFQGLAQLGRITFCEPRDLHRFSLKEFSFRPLLGEALEETVDELVRRLRWAV